MASTGEPSFHAWLIQPLEPAVAQAVDRLRRAPDVHHVAVMPDVHLAPDVCVGTAFATSRLIYPQAVGGDIGCGMLAVPFDAPAAALSDPSTAGKLLAGLGRVIPADRHRRRSILPLPVALEQSGLSHPCLATTLAEDGRLQFGTLGGGNHFIELQADDCERLWLTVHSGSRAMGQAIRAHHLAGADAVGSGLKALDATTPAGMAYLNDVGWARQYAIASRHAMAEQTEIFLKELVGARLQWDEQVITDHNHVTAEWHGGEAVWVHRKGAAPAGTGVAGVLPGSMGTASFHVEGKGCPQSLHSSAHGAGRSMSRERARRRVTLQDIHQQMKGVWYDYRLANELREESPRAYKDIYAVMRAQNDLVKIIRTLRPLLNYKAT
jgi:tRNA-splicing ligase RtcB